jgi:hypothetical protein
MLLAALGVLPRGHDAPDAALPWIGWLLGMVFGSTGIVVIMKDIAGSANDVSGSLPASAPRPLRVVYDLLSVIIVCSLAVLFSWIAFGPGSRHFSVWRFVDTDSRGGRHDGASGVRHRLGTDLGIRNVMVVTTVRQWWRVRR